jgi:hypothetical protein
MFFGVLAVALVIVLLGALLLPRLINSQRIKDKISSELAKKTEGSFIFERIALLWLPRPAVLIEHAEFFFDDTVHGSVRNRQSVHRLFVCSRVVIGGTFEYKKGSPFQLETSGTATIGAVAQPQRRIARRVEAAVAAADCGTAFCLARR